MAEQKTYFIRGDGGVIDLSDHTNYDVRPGINGRWMPKLEYVSTPVYTFPGEVIELDKTPPREFELPLIVRDGTQRGGANSMRYNIRELNRAFSYDIGMPKIVTTAPDGTMRAISCLYEDGMDFEESTNTGRAEYFYMFVITLIAHSPFWYNPVENEIWIDTKTTGEMGISNLNTPFTAYNAGDVPTWPIWALCGSFDEVEILNTTTGEYMDFSSSVSSSQRIYIDTRAPRDVLLNHNTSVFADLTTDSTPFSLMPGENKIVPIFTNPGSGAELRLRWVDQYFGV
jgi:phage-related protein